MKKIIPYILILTVLAGLFSPIVSVDAQTPRGTCVGRDLGGNFSYKSYTKSQCDSLVDDGIATSATFIPDDGSGAVITTGSGEPDQTEFEKQINGCSSIIDASFDGCFLKLFYFIFYAIPAFFLSYAGIFLNALLSIGLDSTLTAGSSFISEAWKIVRDLSNIFFILILIYIAIKTILGLAGHDGKKMIASVVLMALLINFSMFFSKVIIDSSNILALIFYSKLNVETSVNGKAREYEKSTANDKDVSGGMLSAFDPTKMLSPEFFENAKRTMVNGREVVSEKVPIAIMIGIILIAAVVMSFAAYAFLVAGISFLGRLIELWILIIFSPFAFMSFTIPILGKLEYLGWDAWLKRLLTVSFMAPIFMFFMYLIFLIVNADIFKSTVIGTGLMQKLLFITLPAMIILILLLKATSFAKKGGGEIAGAITTGAKMVGGFAGGLALGGVAAAGTKFVGGGAMRIANNDELRRKAAEGDRGAQRTLARANYFAGKSFDLRQTGISKFAASKAGLDLSKGTGVVGWDTEKFKGGYKTQKEKEGKNNAEIAKTWEMTGTVAAEQDRKAIRAKKYAEDRDEAKARIETEGGGTFNEIDFKKAYEKGGRIAILGKNVEGGIIEEGAKTAEDVNRDRRKAYAISKTDKGRKGETREALKNMFKPTPSKIGLAVAATALTGGAAVPLILGGGVLYAIKKAVEGGARSGMSKLADNIPEKGPLTSALREMVRPGIGSEEVAKIVKGKSKKDEFLEHVEHLMDEKKGHGGEAEASHPAPKSPPPATPATGNTPPPTAH